jgi:hypothetical protein
VENELQCSNKHEAIHCAIIRKTLDTILSCESVVSIATMGWTTKEFRVQVPAG